MRKIGEVLRLTHESGLSTGQVAQNCGIGRTTVKDYLSRARKAGLAWPLPAGLDDDAVERLLFPSERSLTEEMRGMPPFEYLHREMKKKHVTMQLLWQEYREKNPDGYQYSQFCLRYRAWKKTLDVGTLGTPFTSSHSLFYQV